MDDNSLFPERLTPDAQRQLGEQAKDKPVTDGNGRVIGKVTDVQININSITVLTEIQAEDYYRLLYGRTTTRHAELVAAHERGEHPYGSMRRDCPLCNR